MSDRDSGLDFFDQDQEETEPEAPKRKRKGRPLLILVILLAVILLVPLGIAAYYGGSALNAFNSIDRDPELTPPDYEGRPEAPEPQPGTNNAPINFVLMGSDARSEDYTGRSDSLMVAHLSGDREHLYLISFPRDLWVDIPGRGKGKINWAYSYGGAPLTVQTLEQLTGARMDHTVAIDFEGFISLTEALGGVTVYNPWSSSSRDYTFPEGEITISGEEALAYVRERYDLPNGDLDRAHRQRTVVQAIIRKVLTRQTLTDPGTFNDVMDTFASSLTVGEDLSVGDVTSIATSLRMDRSDGIRMMMAPVTGTGWVGDQSVVVLDQGRMDQLARAIQNDTVAEYFDANQDNRYERLPEVEVEDEE